MAAAKRRRFAESPSAQRRVLEDVWSLLHDCLPGGIATRKYDIDCIEVGGAIVGGLKGFTHHNSFFPFSGGVVSRIGALPKGCSASQGALRFPVDEVLSASVVRRLVKVRLAELASVEHGRRVVTFPNGALKAVGMMRRGELHGAWSWFRQDGSLMRSGSFRNGEQVGRWRTYDRDGRIVSETIKNAPRARRAATKSTRRAPRASRSRSRSPRR